MADLTITITVTDSAGVSLSQGSAAADTGGSANRGPDPAEGAQDIAALGAGTDAPPPQDLGAADDSGVDAPPADLGTIDEPAPAPDEDA